MSATPSVSLHPYFRVRPGQMDAVRALLRRFVARTSSEPACLYYEFTVNGDVVFCREAYGDGDGVLAHLENVKAELEEMLGHSELVRLEAHGPAAELDVLRGPLAALPVEWFAYECGVER